MGTRAITSDDLNVAATAATLNRLIKALSMVPQLRIPKLCRAREGIHFDGQNHEGTKGSVFEEKNAIILSDKLSWTKCAATMSEIA